MAKDTFHDLVRESLEAEGWIITDDPLNFTFGEVNFQVDLAAERIIAAQKDNQKIAVEIKSFLKASAITDFYGALGQFLSYRLALEQIEPSRSLYLAIPLDSYKTFFQLTFSKIAITKYELKLIVYDSENGGITQWIN
jgi:XisH protein